jgi:hypothetical protein
MESEHTTPTPGQSPVTLARVKDLLARLASECAADQPQPDREPRSAYRANPCLSEPELVAWEAANGVLLPEPYRLFLREIGNGGIMPGSYCNFDLWPLDPRSVDTRLREPFPVSKARFEQQMARLPTEGRTSDPLFPELNESREA